MICLNARHREALSQPAAASSQVRVVQSWTPWDEPATLPLQAPDDLRHRQSC